jgi:DNA polymerase-3 subunit epsilon
LVEAFSWVACLACVLRWMAGRSSGWVPVEGTLEVEGATVITTFRVASPLEGDPNELDHLTVEPAGESPLSLSEAVRRNRGELWTRTTGGSFEVRLGLNRAPAAAESAHQEGIADEQPEFYDFDLFLPRPAREAWDRLASPLAELDCVVFDTETTGLHPTKGDQVVSLSAIRVRRGKLQSAETFHTLVNPGRPIPSESIRFHGIDDAMVENAPSFVQVLPQFYEYVADSVLVAHNAAFDKKFLDLGAGMSGLPLLENPILDTLFLSYGIHRDFEGHNLDAIAVRLGVQVEGRHTSLGDARATAEIFLKLLPLLSARGVVTLGDAKAFCDRMLLLRWQSSRF